MKLRGTHDYYDWIVSVHGEDDTKTVIRGDLPTNQVTEKDRFLREYTAEPTGLNANLNFGPNSDMPVWGSFPTAHLGRDLDQVSLRWESQVLVSVGGQIYYKPELYRFWLKSFLGVWRRHDDTSIPELRHPDGHEAPAGTEDMLPDMFRVIAQRQTLLHPALVEIHRKYNRPVLCFSISKVQGGPERGKLYVNVPNAQPSLKSIGFADTVPADRVYEDIRYFKSNLEHGTPDYMPPTERDEKVFVAQKGFDKHSFRSSKRT